MTLVISNKWNNERYFIPRFLLRHEILYLMCVTLLSLHRQPHSWEHLKFRFTEPAAWSVAMIWINLVWVHHLPPTVIYWYIDLEYDFVSLSVFFLCTCTLTVKRQEIQVSSIIYTFHYSNSTCSVMIDQHCAGNERAYLIGCLHEE